MLHNIVYNALLIRNLVLNVLKLKELGLKKEMKQYFLLDF